MLCEWWESKVNYVAYTFSSPCLHKLSHFMSHFLPNSIHREMEWNVFAKGDMERKFFSCKFIIVAIVESKFTAQRKTQTFSYLLACFSSFFAFLFPLFWVYVAMEFARGNCFSEILFISQKPIKVSSCFKSSWLSAQ